MNLDGGAITFWSPGLNDDLPYHNVFSDDRTLDVHLRVILKRLLL